VHKEDYKVSVDAPRHNTWIKLGGILCQSTYDATGKFFDVTTGVGINTTNQEPSTCINLLLKEVTGGQHPGVTREAVLALFCSIFEGMQARFEREGFTPFKQAYQQAWLHTNQRVTVLEGAQGGGGAEKSVVIKAITNTGGLLAVDDHGIQHELYPDGNSFDFLKGLISKKIG
jgi:biotin--protein ligase